MEEICQLAEKRASQQPGEITPAPTAESSKNLGSDHGFLAVVLASFFHNVAHQDLLPGVYFSANL
jgi:hypothetical protein